MSEEIKHPHSHQKLDEIRKGPKESERTVADQQKGLERFHVKDPASNQPVSENLRKEYVNVQPPATATHPDDKGLWDYKELRENARMPDAHFVSGLTGEDRSHGARSQSHKTK